MSNKIIRTAEFCGAGHCDKVADKISDSVLDECLKVDPSSRVACETFATNGLIVIGGEITTTANLNYEEIIQKVARDVGYDLTGFEIFIAVNVQSPDISGAVDGGEDTGAGDQGVMVGYATDETLNFMPIEYEYARRIIECLEYCAKHKKIDGIALDCKSQVSAEFIDGRFSRFTKILLSVQHDENRSLDELRQDITAKVIGHVFEEFDLSDTEILVNPSGRFVLGGLDADTGLTGRKIVADAYGPRIPVGGGAFSGKDPTKVDRSAAYFARNVAKTVVAAELAVECKVELAYAIGKSEPLAVNIDTFGTARVDEGILREAILTIFDFRPSSIIAELDLLKPIYSATATGGHFGREGFSWEQTDKVDALKAEVERCRLKK